VVIGGIMACKVPDENLSNNKIFYLRTKAMVLENFMELT
jgi:hypothetical protein